MNPQKTDPAFFSKYNGEKTLSGSVLIELLWAVVVEKRTPFRFRAKGSSMSPFVKDGDVITVSPLRNNSLQTGEVVAFLSPQTGRLIVHRIIEKKADGFVIKGDNNPEYGDIVPSSNIFGYISKLERKGRSLPIGIGAEGPLIAFLARRNFLVPMFFPIRKIRQLMRRSVT